MQRLKFGIVLLLAGLLCLTQAQSQLLGVLKGPSTPAGYQGPGDIVSGAAFFGGLYAYNAAYATGSNRAARICDVATHANCSDVNILATGYFDDAGAAALPQCATACEVAELYDQTGNGNNLLVNASPFAPALTFSALSGRAVMTFDGVQSRMVNFAGFSSAQPVSTYAVYKETAGASASMIYWETSPGSGPLQNYVGSASPAVCGVYAGTAGIQVNAAAANTWNACLGIINGASSFASANGTAGSVGDPGSQAPGANFFFGAGFPNGTGQLFTGQAYGIAVYNSALSSGQASSLSANAHTIGGF